MASVPPNPFEDYLYGGEGAQDLESYLGPEFKEFLRRPPLKGLRSEDHEKVARPTPQKVPDIFADYIQPGIDVLNKTVSTPYAGVKTALALGAGSVQGEPLKYIDTPDQTSSLLPVEAKSPYSIVKQELESRFQPVRQFEQNHPFMTAAADVGGEFASQMAFDPVLHGMGALKEAAPLAEAALGAAFIPGMVQGAVQSGSNAYQGYQEKGLTPEVFREGLQAGVDTTFTGMGAYHLGRGLQQLVAEGRITPEQAQVVAAQHESGAVEQSPDEVLAPATAVPEAFQSPVAAAPVEAPAPVETPAPAPVEAQPPVAAPVVEAAPVAPAAAKPPIGEGNDIPPIEQPNFTSGLPGNPPYPPKQKRFDVPAEPVANTLTPPEEYSPEQQAAAYKSQLGDWAKSQEQKYWEWFRGGKKGEPPVQEAPPEPPVEKPAEPAIKAGPPPPDEDTAYWDAYKNWKQQESGGKPGTPEYDQARSAFLEIEKARTQPKEAAPEPRKPDLVAREKGMASKVQWLENHLDGYLEDLANGGNPAEIGEDAKVALEGVHKTYPELKDRPELLKGVHERLEKLNPQAPAPVAEKPVEAATEPSEAPKPPLPAEGEDILTFGKTKRAEIEAHLAKLEKAGESKPIYAYAAQLGIEGFKTGKRRDGVKRTIESIGRHLGWGEGEEGPVPGFTRTGGGYWEFNHEGAKLKIYPRRSQGGIPPVLESFEGEPGAVEAAARTALARLAEHGQVIPHVNLNVGSNEGQFIANKLQEAGLLRPVLVKGKPDVYHAKNGAVAQKFEYLGKEKPKEVEKPAEKVAEGPAPKLIDKLKASTKEGREKELVQTLSRIQRESPGSHVDIDVDLLTKPMLKRLADAGLAKVVDEGDAYVRVEVPKRGVSKMTRPIREEEPVSDRVARIIKAVNGTRSMVAHGFAEGKAEETAIKHIVSNAKNDRPLLAAATYKERELIHKAYLRDWTRTTAGVEPQQVFRDFPSLMDTVNKVREKLGLYHSDEPPKYIATGSWNAVFDAGDGKHVIRVSAHEDGPYLQTSWMIPVVDHPMNKDGFRVDVMPKIDRAYSETGKFLGPMGKSHQEFYADVEALEAMIEGLRDSSGDTMFENLDIKDTNVAYMPDGRLVVLDLGAVEPSVKYKTGRWLQTDTIRRAERQIPEKWTDDIKGALDDGDYKDLRRAVHSREGVDFVVLDPQSKNRYNELTGPASADTITRLLNEQNLFSASKKVWERMREVIGHTSHLIGFTPDIRSMGFWHEGGVVYNPMAHIELAAALGKNDGFTKTIDRAELAHAIVNTLLHEATHDEIPGHGEIFDKQLADYIKQVEPHLDDMVNTLLNDDLSEETLANLSQVMKEHFYGEKPAETGNGTSTRSLAPIPNQPQRSETGPRGSEASRLLAGGDLRGGLSRSAREVGSAPGTPERARNFRGFFGDSEVVDEKGRPQVVYHGTRENFTTFDLNATNQLGWHFGSPGQANERAHQKTTGYVDNGRPTGNVMAVWLRVENGLEMRDQGGHKPEDVVRGLLAEQLYDGKHKDIDRQELKDLLDKIGHLDNPGRQKAVANFLESYGYDGIKYENDIEGVKGPFRHSDPRAWMVWRPEQIKSATGNQGTFSNTDPDIRRSERPQPTPEQEKEYKRLADEAIARAEAKRPPPDKGLSPEAVDALNSKPGVDQIIDWLDAKPKPKRRADGTYPHDIARNLPRTELDAEAKARLGPVYDILNKDLTRSRPVRWAEVSAAAKEIFQTKSPDEFIRFAQKRGFALRPEEDTAARMLVTTREKELLGLADELKAHPEQADELAGKWLRIQADFELAAKAMAESGTNMARGLAFRRMAAQELTPEETRLGKFKASLKTLGVKPENQKELISQFLTKDPKFRDTFRRALDPSFTDKALEFWKAGLVSGPATKLANLASNFLFRNLRDVENLFGVGLDVARSKLTGTARERYLGEIAFSYHMYGRILGGEEGAIAQWIAGHVAIGKGEFLSKPFATSKFDIEHPGSIGGKFGEYVRAPFKSLEVDDTLFKHLSAGLEVARRAYRRAMKDQGPGTVTSKATQIYAEMMDVVRHGNESKYWKTKGYEKEFKEIEDTMLRDTFQNPLEKLGQAIMQAQRGSVPIQVLLPFIKTPANIAKEAILRTPYGFWKTYRKIRARELKGGAAAEEFAKPLVGTMIGMSMAMAAMEGHMTGGGPGDPKLEENLRETGWQPYSFKIGGQYISYQRLEPLSSIFGMAADFAEGVKDWDELTAGKVAQRIVGSVTENLTNKTFLSGLEGFFTFWHDPLRYGERWAKQLTASLVPNIVGSVARGIDPAYRKTGIFTAPLAKIPGLSTQLPAQKTPTGQVRTRPGGAIERMISPFPRTAEKGPEADVNREMNRIGYVPAAPRDTITFRGKKVDLTDKEVELLEKSRVRATAALLRVIRDPSYRRLPDDHDAAPFGYKGKTKQQILENVYKKYMDQARDQVKPVALQRALRHHAAPLT